MNKTYDFFPAALLGDMLTARLISDNLQIKVSLGAPAIEQVPQSVFMRWMRLSEL